VRRKAHAIFARLAPVVPSKVYDTYWHFAAERQAIFYRRLANTAPPWTRDPILSEYKFTNAYRASDRVSQYLIRKVIYEGDQTAEEIFFRTILFKLFNKISTWELLMRHFGTVTAREFRPKLFGKLLAAARARGERIYSAAYIMPSGGYGYERKHDNHLALLQQMLQDRAPARVGDAKNLQSVFDLLRSYPTIGSFLAYQYAIDLNYSPLVNFSEDSFVVPGPGALDGIRKCFANLGGLNESNIIKLVTERQAYEFQQRDIPFRDLWGRSLHQIDTQNLFCEISKYARIAHPEVKGVADRTRIKQRHRPIAAGLEVWYPPKWNINNRIREE
jgi:hypothetical protein